jgi:ubiquinone/menaquinone biosynthesis C-methylase UbiE
VSLDAHLQDCERFFDGYASIVDTWHQRNRGYHRAVSSLAQFNVPADASVLEIGCGTGNLLAALRPRRGLGIDVSSEMVRLAKKKHPNLEFRHIAVEYLDLNAEHFDYHSLRRHRLPLLISGWSLSECRLWSAHSHCHPLGTAGCGSLF